MKNIKALLLIIILLSSLDQIFAQQEDYKTVQNFKIQYLQIEHAIKNADSLAQLYVLQEAIDTLKSNYLPHKNLLDKSLYPDDFNAAITNLTNALILRERDFSQISSLKMQVGELKIQIDSLNSTNTLLLNRVQLLQVQSQKDKKTISALEQNISSLLVSLHRRDDLIMNMMDSLMPPAIRENAELNKGEKQKVYSEVEKGNVLNNIKRAINDNLKFLELTYLNPEDIEKIKKQENQFESLWKSISPQITAIYSDKGEDKENIVEINAGFKNWRRALYLEAWSTIRQDFRSHGINLNNFTNGDEFVSRITSFIDDEIKNAKLQGDESRRTYHAFADSAWFGDVKPKWMAYLTGNNMLSEAQKNSIENKIAQWEDVAYPGSTSWIFILIGALIIFVVVPIMFRRRKMLKNPNKLTGVNKDKLNY